MSEHAVQEASIVQPAERPEARWRFAMRRYGWLVTAVGVIMVSTILVLWAGARPGYDPFGWLVWGYQTLHGSLDLGGAPSWKPLPYLFTIPYALAGHYQLWLWMITAVSVSLAGGIFGGRVAYRVTGGGSGPVNEAEPILRYAPVAAAVFAGAAVLGVEDYAHYILSAQSDPLIVTFCLAGIDMHLCRRYRWAFGLGVLGALGRPEVWPFLALYSIWVWLRAPSMRWMLCAGIALIGFTWFGIPWITNGRPNIAGQLAMNSPRELRSNEVTGTIARFIELQYLPVWIAALGAVALAWLRRDRVVLVLGGGVVLWIMVEIAFALHGFPALPRYMFEAAGVAAVLGGVGVGWALIDLPKLSRGLPHWSGVPVAAILVLCLVPIGLARARTERSDLRHERGRAHQIAWLQTTIDGLGGYRHVRNCGEPVTIVEYASVLAWMTHLNVGSVGYRPKTALRRRRPVVLFTPVLVLGGWTVQPRHTRPRQRRRCSNLRAAYRLSPRHAAGKLVHG